MSRLIRALVAACLALAAPMSMAETLTPGVKAPAFELTGTDGETRTLSDYVGKRGVVLAWFPKAFTPG
jgi:peroxiredoxin Q/BCP